MTRSISFTQASLRRAIEAALKAGLRVTGIKPDGTLIVDGPEQGVRRPAPLANQTEVVL